MGDVHDIEPDELRGIPTFRAAYSDRTALLMAKLAKRVYDPFDDAATLAAFQARFTPLGLTVHEQLIDRGKGTAGAVLANNDLIVVVFRGTEDLLDWLTNLRAGWVVLQGGVGVHRGFFEAYWPVRAALFRRLLDLIHEKPRPVYVTGHSLGGALALMAAAELGNHDEAQVRDSIAACYTFGCPKAGDRTFDRHVKVPLYRITNGFDLVPALPPLLTGYRHVGDTRHFAVAGEAPSRRGPSYPRQLASTARALLLWLPARLVDRKRFQNVADHDMANYIDKMSRFIRAQSERNLARRQATAAPSLP